jgi:hypothetical protein
MSTSRRDFLTWISGLILAVPACDVLVPFAVEAAPAAFDPKLLPNQNEVRRWQLWMNGLGPRYTGNPAHAKFVEFLVREFRETGLRVERDQCPSASLRSVRRALA